MNIKSILNTLARTIRKDGLGAGARFFAKRAKTRFWEWRYGIRTNDVIFLDELGISDRERGEYCPTEYDDFKALMQRAEIRPGEDVFLDFGAGQGRVVVLAATYPFRRVIGVELSEQLGRTARRNIENARASFRCGAAEMVTCDATQYEVPADVTIFFFNNPFHGGVLDRVLANIRASLAARPRRVSLVCNLPGPCPFETEIRAQKWLVLREELALPSGRKGMILEGK